MISYNNGSEWARWDLHLHTPYSGLNNQYGDPEGEETWNKFIYELVYKAKENGIAAVGVTDYFSIDGYQKIKKILSDSQRLNEIFSAEQSLIEYAKSILFLPNIELRLDQFVGKRSIDYHVIFSNELDPKFIIENFLSKLDTSITGSGNNLQKKSLTRSNIKEIGEEMKELTGECGSPYNVGLNHITVSYEKIHEVLNKNDSFKGKFIVGAPVDEDLSSVSWFGRDAPTRKNIYQSCDFYFTSNRNTISWALGKKSRNEDEYLKQFGKLRPCIHGSDAHSIDKLFKPDEERYCWIKAKPTFEGLLQILAEPEDRVKIQNSKPETKNEFQVIDYVVIDDERIQDEKIYFSQNLNCIIGGRSTGKSLLLTNIVNALDAEQLKDKEEKTINKLLNLQNVRVFWKDKTINNDGGSKRIVYIPQSYLNRLVDEKEKDTEIDELIKETIFLNKNIKGFYDKYKEKKQELHHSVNENILKLFHNYEKNIELKSKLKENGTEKDLKLEINKINNEINAKNTEEQNLDEQLGKYDKLKENIDHLNKELEKITLDIKLFSDEIEVLLEFKSEDKLKYKLSKEFISQLKTKYTSKIREFFSSDIEQQIGKLRELEIETRQKLSNLKPEHDQVKTKIDNNNQIREMVSHRDKLNSALNQAQILSLEIEKSELLVDNLISDLSEVHEKYYEATEKYVVASNELITDTILVYGTDVMFELNCSIKLNAFKDKILDIFDNRSIKNETFLWDGEDIIYSREAIKKLIRKTLNDTIKVKQKYSKKEAITHVLLNYYNVNYLASMEEDYISDMSPGKRSLVLLRLLLEMNESKWPILIDQPEDDLDNRSIFNDLVRYIKTKKKERQIIMVTHNANLVVGADSEQIIIANQNSDNAKNHSKRFEYRVGSIEDTGGIEFKTGVLYDEGIKEQVCKILEGGERAFELRAQKYFYKR